MQKKPDLKNLSKPQKEGQKKFGKKVGPRTLYQSLCSHTLLDILPDSDLKLLEELSKNKKDWYPDFFRENPLFRVVTTFPFYILMQTGCQFSQEYRKKTLQHFQKKGFSKLFICLLEAAQTQMVDILLFSSQGCFPDVKKPEKLKPLNQKTSISNKDMLKNLKYFHEMYPVELLTSILNGTLK
jgi:hypothetical protein